jgi:hypothetical protein
MAKTGDLRDPTPSPATTSRSDRLDQASFRQSARRKVGAGRATTGRRGVPGGRLNEGVKGLQRLAQHTQLWS